MQQLETTKGKSVVVPRLVNRYILMYYDVNIGWRCEFVPYTTPESAIQSFIERINKYKSEKPEYYKVIEVELEVPFVPQSSE